MRRSSGVGSRRILEPDRRPLVGGAQYGLLVIDRAAYAAGLPYGAPWREAV